MTSGRCEIFHENAKKLAVQARCLGADRLCSFVDWTEERELASMYNNKAATLRQQREERLTSFKTSKGALAWQRQHETPCMDEATRFKPLLLLGDTRQVAQGVQHFWACAHPGGELSGSGL